MFVLRMVRMALEWIKGFHSDRHRKLSLASIGSIIPSGLSTSGAAISAFLGFLKIGTLPDNVNGSGVYRRTNVHDPARLLLSLPTMRNTALLLLATTAFGPS
jgi:hypothetical protein